ncbi:hypothetical protein FS749_010012 [Ceratobasidium sp. UAMH 11750]|nr:hypothetical protein FS749_010012 [Ceratobasidium sp. UAMH 11750]
MYDSKPPYMMPYTRPLSKSAFPSTPVTPPASVAKPRVKRYSLRPLKYFAFGFLVTWVIINPNSLLTLCRLFGLVGQFMAFAAAEVLVRAVLQVFILGVYIWQLIVFVSQSVMSYLEAGLARGA